MDGKCISDLEPIDRDIAMVFQDYALYPHMDVFKNMSFALRLAKHSKDDIKKRVTEVAEMLGSKSISIVNPLNYLRSKTTRCNGSSPCEILRPY